MVRTLVFVALTLPLLATAAEPTRIGSDRFRQAGPVSVLVYSPDGTQLASVDGDAVHLWDAANGRRQVTIRLDKHRIDDLAFAADARTLFAVAADDAGWHLCRLDPGGSVRDRQPIVRWGRGWMFGPGGRHLAYWDGEWVARVLDTATGESVAAARIPPRGETADRFSAAAFRADGTAVAFGTDGGLVGVFDPVTGKSIHQHQLAERGVRHVAFAADGKDLLVETSDGVLRLDVATGRVRWRYEGYMTRLPTFTADGRAVRYFGVTRDFAVPMFAWRHLDAETGKPLDRKVHTPAGFGAVAVRPDGKVLAIGGADPLRFGTFGLISQWNLHTGRRLTASADPPELVTDLRFSPDGTTVRGHARGWHQWDVRTGRQTRLSPPVPTEWAARSAVSNDQKWYARIVYRGDPEPRRVERIDLRTGASRFLRTGQVELDVIRFLDDGRLLVREKDGMAAYDPDSGERRAWVPVNKDAEFAASADGTTAVLMFRAEGGVRIERWDLAAGKHVETWRGRFPHPADIFQSFRRDVWLSGDGRALAVSFFDAPFPGAYTCVFDVRTGKPLSGWFNSEAVTDVIFRADSRTVALQFNKGSVLQVREVATGYIRHEVPVVGRPTGCALSPDGQWLAVAVTPGPIEVHDLLAGGTTPWGPAAARAAWVGLGGRCGEEVAMAFRDLLAHPADAVRTLKERTPAPAAPTDEWVAARITALDAPRFRDRERATAELAEVGERAIPALRAARATASPEARERLAILLDRAEGPSPGELRSIRACELLEALGTPESRELLATWAKGPVTATLAREAAASVERLRARPPEIVRTEPRRPDDR